MEKEQPKKCFCARCFLPIEEEDKVDIGGQNFHRTCSTCCVCRQIPKSIKMFYGHVFCAECFKEHVLGQFRNEAPRMHSCSWWAQWAPGMNPNQQPGDKEMPDCKSCSNTEEPCKKCICSRCLQPVDEKEKVDIGGQHFHPQCAKCYFCHTVPKSNLKIYYGQVFCEECFNRHVLNRNRDNPSEFFKTCFEQWQNVQFAEGMRQFMGCKEGSNPPFVFCRCAGGTEWGAQPDTRKYGEEDLKNLFKLWTLQKQLEFTEAMWKQIEVHKSTKMFAAASPTLVPSSIAEDDSLEDLYIENRTEMSDLPEPTEAPEPGLVAEKIEKLTKYLHETPSVMKSGKKWKNFVEPDKISLTSCGWVDLQERASARIDCPKCLWQCGPIYVPSELLERCDL